MLKKSRTQIPQRNTAVSRFLYETEAKEAEPETIEVPAPDETRQPQNISLDQKVDHYFIQYERESIPSSKEYAAEARRRPRKSLLDLIFEADDPMTDPAAAEAPGGDLGGADMGATPPEGEAPPPATGVDVPVPSININNFASNLARLVNNFEALVNPKEIVMKRAQAYITKNYNENTAKELMITLDLQFGLTPRNKDDQDKDLPERPIAAGGIGDGSSGGSGGAEGI